jgi:hypothetical protein
MPVIVRGPSTAQPLPPEGPAKLYIQDVGSGRSANKQTPFFELNVSDLATGIRFKTRLYLVATASWKTDACCRSAGLVLPPNNAPYRVTPDDLEHRVCYALLEWKQTDQGRTVVNIKSFWTSKHAFEQAPQLERLPNPPGAILTAKELPVEQLPPEIASPPAAVPPPVAPSASPASPAPLAHPAVSPAPNPFEGLNEDQVAAAMAYAQSLRPLPKPVGE